MRQLLINRSRVDIECKSLEVRGLIWYSKSKKRPIEWDKSRQLSDFSENHIDIMKNSLNSISDADEYKARDLGLCSALYTTPGVRLVRLQRDAADNFIWFIFNNRSLCEKTAQLYWFDSLAISNAKAFNDARKQLMDRLHANY